MDAAGFFRWGSTGRCVQTKARIAPPTRGNGARPRFAGAHSPAAAHASVLADERFAHHRLDYLGGDSCKLAHLK